MLVLEPHGNNRKYSRDKANIDNPKVNRGCPPLTANRTSADCVEITPGPSIHHIPLGFYHTGGFNALATSLALGQSQVCNNANNGPGAHLTKAYDVTIRKYCKSHTKIKLKFCVRFYLYLFILSFEISLKILNSIHRKISSSHKISIC